IHGSQNQGNKAEKFRQPGFSGYCNDRYRQQCADHDHGRNRIGDAHQRRVQRGRYAPDNVIADQDRENENREAENKRIDGFHGASLQAAFSAGCVIAPPRVRFAPLIISSSQLICALPVFLSTSRLTKLNRLRAYRLDASTASRPGRFVKPMTMTPWASITWPGLVSGQLPPCS